MDNNSPFKVYSIATQLSGMIIVPLLLFIGGGSWLVDKLAWPEWVKIICVVLGIAVMVSTVAAFLRRLFTLYDDLKEKKAPMFDKRDYDFYDDNYKFKK